MNPGFNPSELEILKKASQLLADGFEGLPESSASPGWESLAALNQVLTEVAQRLQDNFPYFHPLYAGQMLKPPHPAARLVYTLALGLNPNNHALDGGRATSAMEKEAVDALATMVGWKSHLGHLCGGGTMANLEALWVAGSLHPGKTIIASEQAHYTHQRICQVLSLPFESIRANSQGQIDPGCLEGRLQ